MSRIVCVCSGASEEQVRDAIRRGADTIEDLGKMVRGTGQSCENCHAALHALLRVQEETEFAEPVLTDDVNAESA